MSNSPPPLFDRALYLARQAAASGHDDLRTRIEEDLADRLSLLVRKFERTHLISPWPETADIVRAAGRMGKVEYGHPRIAERLELVPQSCDAIISILDLHAINDVRAHLESIVSALRPDGLFMVALFSGETLTELRATWLAAEVEVTGGASPRVAPMIGLQDLGRLLQHAGLALPVADTDRFTVRYADPLALMREIKTMGYANALLGRSSKFTSRRLLLHAAQHYAATYADPDGRIRATIEIAWANAWKPHPSQPKPLKPGSGKVSLVDVFEKKS
jgi:SAM-dependent methyltransferase